MGFVLLSFFVQLRLAEWVFGLKSFRENHGMTGGETNRDDEIVAESLARRAPS